MIEEMVNGKQYDRYYNSMLTLPTSIFYFQNFPQLCDFDQTFNGIECNSPIRNLKLVSSSVTLTHPGLYIDSSKGYTFSFWSWIISTSIFNMYSLHVVNDVYVHFNNSYNKLYSQYSAADNRYIYVPNNINWVNILITQSSTMFYLYACHAGSIYYNYWVDFRNLGSGPLTITIYPDAFTTRSIHVSYYPMQYSHVAASYVNKNQFDANLFVTGPTPNSNLQINYQQSYISSPLYKKSTYSSNINQRYLEGEYPQWPECPHYTYFSIYRCINIPARIVSQFISTSDMFDRLNIVFFNGREVMGFWVFVNSYSLSYVIKMYNSSNDPIFSLALTNNQTIRVEYSSLVFILPLNDTIILNSWNHITYGHYKENSLDYQAVLLNGNRQYGPTQISSFMFPSSITNANFLDSASSQAFFDMVFLQYNTPADLYYLYLNSMRIDIQKTVLWMCAIASKTPLVAIYLTASNFREYKAMTTTDAVPGGPFKPIPECANNTELYFSPANNSFTVYSSISLYYAFDAWVLTTSLDNIFSLNLDKIFLIQHNTTDHRVVVKKDATSPQLIASNPILENTYYYIALINSVDGLCLYIGDAFKKCVSRDTPLAFSNYSFFISNTLPLVVSQPRIWNAAITIAALKSFKYINLEGHHSNLIFHLVPFVFKTKLPKYISHFDYSTYSKKVSYSIAVESTSILESNRGIPLCNYNSYFNGIKCTEHKQIIFKARNYGGPIITLPQDFDLSSRTWTLECMVNLRIDVTASTYNPIAGIDEYNEKIYAVDSVTGSTVEEFLRYENPASNNMISTKCAVASTSDWHHMAIVVNKTLCGLYLNSILQVSLSLPAYVPSSYRMANVIVGRTWNSDNQTNRMIGITHLRLWKFAMTPRQLSLNMRNAIPSYYTASISELAMGFDFTRDTDTPTIIEDQASSFKHKLIACYFSSSYDAAAAFVDNPIKIYSPTNYINYHCPENYKFCAASGRCQPTNNKNVLSLLITYQNKFQIPYSAFSYYIGDFTINFWLKFVVLKSAFDDIVGQYPQSTPYISIRYYSTNSSIIFNANGNTMNFNSYCQFQIYDWNYFSLINDRNANTISLYNHNELCGSLSSIEGLPTKDISIYGSTEQYSQFKLREFQIWAEARSIGDANLLKFSTVSETTTNLIIYYKISEGTGTMLYEAVSHAKGITANCINITTAKWTYDWDLAVCPYGYIYDKSCYTCNVPQSLMLLDDNSISVSIAAEYNYELTIEAWIYLASMQDTVLISQNNHFALSLNANTICGSLTDVNGVSYSVCSTKLLSYNLWVYTALSFNSLGLPSYVMTDEISTAFVPKKVYEFGGYLANPIVIKGAVFKEFKVWSCIMPSSDLYSNRYKKIEVMPSCLISYLPLTMQIDGTIKDFVTQATFTPDANSWVDVPDYKFLQSKYNAMTPISSYILFANKTLEIQNYALEMWVKSSADYSILTISNQNDTTNDKPYITIQSLSSTYRMISNGNATINIPYSNNVWQYVHYSNDMSSQLLRVLYSSTYSTYQMASVAKAFSTSSVLQACKAQIGAGSYAIKSIRYYSSPPNMVEAFLARYTYSYSLFPLANEFTITSEIISNKYPTELPISGGANIQESITDSFSDVELTSKLNNSIFLQNTNSAPATCDNGFVNQQSICISPHVLRFTYGKTQCLTLTNITFGANPYSIGLWVNSLTLANSAVLKYENISVIIESQYICWMPNLLTKLCTVSLLPNNTWTHYMITNGDSNIQLSKIYINGIENKASVQYSSGISINANMYIGSNTSAFNGILAHLSLWAQYIPASYAHIHYRSQPSKYAPYSLVAYYSLLSKSGNDVVDEITGNRNTIAFTSSPVWVELLNLYICPQSYAQDDNYCLHPSKYKNDLKFSGNKTIELPISRSIANTTAMTVNYWFYLNSLDAFTLSVENVLVVQIDSDCTESLILIDDLARRNTINSTNIIKGYWVMTHVMYDIQNGHITQYIYSINREIKFTYSNSIYSQDRLPRTQNIEFLLTNFDGYIKSIAVYHTIQDIDFNSVNDIFIYPDITSAALVSYYPLNESIGTAVHDLSSNGSYTYINFTSMQWNSLPMEKCIISYKVMPANDWKFIEIVFNVNIKHSLFTPLENSTSHLCQIIFNSTALNGSLCSMAKDKIIIQLSEYSTIVSGDKLAFSQKALIYSTECDDYSLNDSYADPIIPSGTVYPSATFEYPVNSCYCTDIIVRISNLTGTLYRFPAISYSCSSAVSNTGITQNCNALNNYFNNLISNSSILDVTIPAGIILPNITYNITALIVNCQGNKYSQNLVIKTVSDGIIGIQYNGPNPYILQSWEHVSIKYNITEQTCNQKSLSQHSVTWKLISPNITSLEYSINSNYSLNYSLIIPPNTLNESTNYTLLALLDNVPTNTSIKIATYESPLVAIIANHITEACGSSNVTIDCSHSYDTLTHSNEGISYEWKCKNIYTLNVCTYANGTASATFLTPSISFLANQYTDGSGICWVCKVSKPNRVSKYINATVHISKKCTNTYFPFSLIPLLLKYNYSNEQFIPLKAEVQNDSSCNDNYMWAIDGTQINSSTAYDIAPYNERATLKPIVAKGGHIISANITRVCSSGTVVGYGAINITVIDSPHNGYLLINANAGIEFDTEFMFSFYSWVSDQSDLYYSVEYKLVGLFSDYRAIQAQDKASRISSYLIGGMDSSSNIVQVRGKVCDIYQSCAYSQPQSITVMHKSTNPSISVDYILNMINSSNGDARVKQSYYDMLIVSQYLLSDAEYKKKVQDIWMDSFITEAKYYRSESILAMRASSLNFMITNHYISELSGKYGSAIQNMVDVLSNSTTAQKNRMPKEMLINIYNATMQAYKQAANRSSLSTNIYAVTKALFANSQYHSAYSEVYNQSSILTILKNYNPALNNTVLNENSNSKITVMNQEQTHISGRVNSVIILYDSYPLQSTILSRQVLTNGVSVTLYDETDESSISGPYANPIINIQFKINSSQSKQCAYYDQTIKSFRIENSAKAASADSVDCKFNHLTDFLIVNSIDSIPPLSSAPPPLPAFSKVAPIASHNIKLDVSTLDTLQNTIDDSSLRFYGSSWYHAMITVIALHCALFLSILLINKIKSNGNKIYDDTKNRVPACKLLFIVQN